MTGPSDSGDTKDNVRVEVFINGVSILGIESCGEQTGTNVGERGEAAIVEAAYLLLDFLGKRDVDAD